MRRLTFLLAFMPLGAAPAAAQPTWFYIRGDVGASLSRDVSSFDSDLGTATVFGGGLGFKILPFIRTDLTVNYRTGYEIDSSVSGVGALRADVNNLTGMFNAYFDFPEFWRLQPYIGGGIGVSYNQVDSSAVNGIEFSGDDTTDLAWQAGFGTAISLIPGVALDLGYRYVDLGEIKTRSSALGRSISGDLTAHELIAGIRIGF
jgi:opacity protein-like surface antigen